MKHPAPRGHGRRAPKVGAVQTRSEGGARGPWPRPGGAVAEPRAEVGRRVNNGGEDRRIGDRREARGRKERDAGASERAAQVVVVGSGRRRVAPVGAARQAENVKAKGARTKALRRLRAARQACDDQLKREHVAETGGQNRPASAASRFSGEHTGCLAHPPTNNNRSRDQTEFDSGAPAGGSFPQMRSNRPRETPWAMRLAHPLRLDKRFWPSPPPVSHGCMWFTVAHTDYCALQHMQNRFSIWPSKNSNLV